MKSEILQEAIERISNGGRDERDVDLVLSSYKPLFYKYLGIINGHYSGPSGNSYLSDHDVQRFAGEFKNSKSLILTLRWVSTRCARFSQEELYQEIIRVFLSVLRYKNWFFIFPMHLARSVAQLISDPIEEIFIDPTENDEFSDGLSPRLHPSIIQYANMGIPLAEQIFDERGVILTDRERQLLRLLSENYCVHDAALTMGVNYSRAYAILKSLRRKAKIS